MNILLTGANGQLGRELVRQSHRGEFHVHATDLPDIDIGTLTWDPTYGQLAPPAGREELISPEAAAAMDAIFR